MELVQWSRLLETGLQEVDEQHRHLVNVTNEFGNCLSQNQIDHAALEKVFAELVSYTQYHFNEEEKIMEEVGVDLHHADRHRQEHRGFLEEVNVLYAQTALDGTTGRTLFDFLINWLIYHILGSDRSLGKQVGAIKAGLSAAQAYQQGEQDVDQATALLLQSVDNLFNQVSLRSRQLNELNQTLEQKVAERTRELSAANQRLDLLASTDVLTGLSNRRHAIKVLEQLWREAQENEHPLSCLMIDADGFKQINDSFGHDAGDLVLRELARELKYAVRTDDAVCRLGGDEFLILCPNTDAEGAMTLAEQMHQVISRMSVEVPGGAWQGSISVGVATRDATMQKPEDLIKIADRGVYAAKEAGRNCVRRV